MAALDRNSRVALLQRARSAIARAMGLPLDSVAPVADRALHSESSLAGDFHAGAFVTLRIYGRLRGCIGYPDPELPLVEAVERCAVSAAMSDPRFPPLSPEEWRAVELEVSVLGSIEPVGHIDEVTVGLHGLVVEYGWRRGLLLPQVAVEWKWDAVEFAAQTCLKAGLPRDAWEKDARLFRFEADVFGDD